MKAASAFKGINELRFVVQFMQKNVECSNTQGSVILSRGIVHIPKKL